LKEKLIIRNFGPIKDVELELGKFNVLIGEQATGKSTVAKVLAVCRYFSYIIDNNSDLEQPFEIGLNAWGLKEFIQDKSFISYQSKLYSFTAERTIVVRKINLPDQTMPFEVPFPTFNFKLTVNSEEFQKLINELNELKPKKTSTENDELNNYYWVIPTSFFQNNVNSVMDNPFYLPTERGLQSIFSLGKSSIQNISDSLFNQFARMDQIARLFKKETLIEPLNITYKNVDGKGYIRKDRESKFYSLYNAASGYQSTIPVVLLIKYYNEMRKKKKTFIVEEPELNLFPSSQNELVKFLAENISNSGSSILLTTHSPYVLTSLNNLMYAFNIGQGNEKEVDAILPKKNWINPKKVSAYMMLPNGTCKSIIDKEGLIKTENIDGVSADLNKQFNLIMDIEIGVVK
jgi:predicted ATP-dependent endonuclease of OLD family